MTGFGHETPAEDTLQGHQLQSNLFFYGLGGAFLLNALFFANAFQTSPNAPSDSMALRFLVSVVGLAVCYSSRFFNKLSLIKGLSFFACTLFSCSSAYFLVHHSFIGIHMGLWTAFLFASSMLIPSFTLFGILCVLNAVALAMFSIGGVGGPTNETLAGLATCCLLLCLGAFLQWGRSRVDKNLAEVYQHTSRTRSTVLLMASKLKARLGELQGIGGFGEEINRSVGRLSHVTKDVKMLSQDIPKRAELSHENTRCAQLLCDKLKTWEQRFADRSTDISETAVSMGALVQSTQEIIEVTETIRSISQQIGLLSLNASIESARAGEYGRGFAVVAEEIGNLASISSEAVKGIEKKIAALREVADQSSENVKTVTHFFDDLRAEVQELSEVSDQIKARAYEQGGMMNQLSHVMGVNCDALVETQKALDGVYGRAAQFSRSTVRISEFAREVEIRLDSELNVMQNDKGGGLKNHFPHDAPEEPAQEDTLGTHELKKAA